MNFLLATGKEDAERSAGAPSCLYCKRVFNSPQALWVHLRTHQKEMKSRGIWNHPGDSSSSVDITRINPYPFTNSLWGYSQRFSNETAVVDASKFPGNGLENAKTHSPAMSSPVFASPSSIMATGFPSDHSLSVGRNEVCQFNTDKIRSCPGFLPFPFRGALPNFQGHEFNDLPYPTFAMTAPHPYPALGSNQSPGIKEPTTTGSHSFWSGSHLSSGRNEVSLSGKGNDLTRKRAKKRLNLCDAPGIANSDKMNASKRPKIRSNPPVEMENSKMKDLPLSVDVEKSFSALGIFVDAKERGHSTKAKVENHMDLDLSLHL